MNDVNRDRSVTADQNQRVREGGRRYVSKRARISVRTLRTAQAEARATGVVVTLTDTEQRGFVARCYPSGMVTFEARYRVAGKQRRFAFGAWGSVWSPDRARDEVESIRAAARRGEDPAEEKERRAATPTVAAFAERYMAERACVPILKPSTATEYRRILERHVLPAWGGRRLDSVTHADVIRLHASLQSTPYMANRVLATVAAMFSYAEDVGELPEGSSPARKVKPFRERKRERLLTHEELARLGEALRRAETEGLPIEPERWKRGATGPHRTLPPEAPSALRAIRLILLTGARRGEILSLRWREVDFEAGVLRLEDSKTGPKVIPLGAPALAILEAARREPESDTWVFPGPLGRPYRDLHGPWRRIRAAAGLPNLRMHDLRHVFGSMAAIAGYGLTVVGAVLGHRHAETTLRYSHVANDPRKALADDVAGRLAAALDGGGGGSDGRTRP